MRVSIELGPKGDARVEPGDVVRVHEYGEGHLIVTADAAAYEFATCSPELSRAMLDSALEVLLKAPEQLATLARVRAAFSAVRRVLESAEGLGVMTICVVSDRDVEVHWVGGDVVSVGEQGFTQPHTYRREGAPSGSWPSKMLTSHLPRSEFESARLRRKPGQRVMVVCNELVSRVDPADWSRVDALLAEGQRGDLEDSPFWFYVRVD